MTDLLDPWLPDPAIRTLHRRRAADATPDGLWAAAQSIRLDDTPTLGRLVRWRIPGTPGTLTFRELFSRYPFVVLDEGERHSVSGLCGRIWTLQRDYPRLTGADEYTAWDRKGTVKVAFAHWVDDDGVLYSEARVGAMDRFARLRLRALWAVMGKFERLIGAEPLSAAVRRAERDPAPARPDRSRRETASAAPDAR
jgi:hypothetical protein